MTSDILLALGTNSWAIALAIILATFVLEDAASVGAALLSASGAISMPLAIGALVVGIFAGDLGLYALGRAARTQDWARARIGEARIVRGRRWLDQRLVPTLLAARFIPGSRLPTYAASGFLAVPFTRFVAVTAGASVLWIAIIFAIAMLFGAAALEFLGEWKWLIGAVLLMAVIFAPRLMESDDV
jgi:membrane protein DedA with SNARE-associated domain